MDFHHDCVTPTNTPAPAIGQGRVSSLPACSSDVLDAKKPSRGQYLSKPDILTAEGGGLPSGTNRQRGMLLAAGSLTVPPRAAVENGMLTSEGHPDPSPESSQVGPTAQPQKEGRNSRRDQPAHTQEVSPSPTARPCSDLNLAGAPLPKALKVSPPLVNGAHPSTQSSHP